MNFTTAMILFAFVLGRASGENPAKRDSRMEWWREVSFGMFVHWVCIPDWPPIARVRK